jgi:nucleotide-binding universal stress UspA family protein
MGMDGSVTTYFGREADRAGGQIGAVREVWVHEKGLPHVRRAALVDQLGGSLLLATDLSDGSRDANERATQLAEEAGIPLLILAIVPTGSSPDGLFREHLAAVVRLARERGIDAEGSLRVGDPAQTILSVAASIGAGTIVLGDDQWRGSENGGSIIGHVVLHAPCPVLLTSTPRA